MTFNMCVLLQLWWNTKGGLFKKPSCSSYNIIMVNSDSCCQEKKPMY